MTELNACVHRTTDDPSRRDTDTLPEGTCRDVAPCDLVVRADCPYSTQVPRRFYHCECVSEAWSCRELPRDMGMCLTEPPHTDAGIDVDASGVDAAVDASGIDAAVDAPEAGEECPVQSDGTCGPECLQASGRQYDPSGQCLRPSEFLTCFDQDATPPAEPVLMVAPDGTCWLVNPAVGKLDDLGWTNPQPGGPCDGVSNQGVPLCD